MAELGEEAALAVVPVHHALGAQVVGVDEGVVDFLSRAHQSVHFQLFHDPVGTSAQLSAGRRHVGQEERAKLRRLLQGSTDMLTRNLLADRHFLSSTKGVGLVNMTCERIRPHCLFELTWLWVGRSAIYQTFTFVKEFY